MLQQQLCFEDVEIGTELPVLQKAPTSTQLFLYSAVTRNAHRIHYDAPYAGVEEHPDVLVHGPLHGAFLSQLVTDWIGPEGILWKFSYSNRQRAVPGDELTCRGRVTNKYERNGQRVVECDVWEENQRGEVVAPGSAAIILPSRK